MRINTLAQFFFALEFRGSPQFGNNWHILNVVDPPQADRIPETFFQERILFWQVSYQTTKLLTFEMQPISLM